jgi:IS5 family transposase
MAAPEAQAAATGKQPKGKAPKPPAGGPRSEDQINLTDEASRIMPDSGGGFEQSYNAQAMVDHASLRVLVAHVTQATNDKQQLQPMLEQLQALPTGLNRPETLVADTGYYSEKNVTACQDAAIEPLIAVQREAHHPDWKQRFSEPQPLPQGATPVETMQHRRKTRTGKAAYALRKQTVEPVFGLLKSVMGFRQFLLRGLEHVRNEWTLVCLAWNLRRMAILRP